jgi:hypothetical protein
MRAVYLFEILNESEFWPAARLVAPVDEPCSLSARLTRENSLAVSRLEALR